VAEQQPEALPPLEKGTEGIFQAEDNHASIAGFRVAVFEALQQPPPTDSNAGQFGRLRSQW
jgi:hypothetical protein